MLDPSCVACSDQLHIHHWPQVPHCASQLVGQFVSIFLALHYGKSAFACNSLVATSSNTLCSSLLVLAIALPICDTNRCFLSIVQHAAMTLWVLNACPENAKTNDAS